MSEPRARDYTAPKGYRLVWCRDELRVSREHLASHMPLAGNPNYCLEPRDEIGALTRRAESAEADRQAVEAENARLRSLLQRLEWDKDGTADDQCPSCGAFKSEGRIIADKVTA